MSKKSIELANNKRTKILNDLQKNRKIETIELYHILSYKKEIGKYTVSKIEEGCIDLPKKKAKNVNACMKKSTKNEGKKKVNKNSKVSGKQNKVSNKDEKTIQKDHERTVSEEIKQITDNLDD